jgi:hypothetical protein
MSTLMEVPAAALQGSFAGHETFAFRYAWLKKGVDGLEREPDIFGQEAAMVRLGVGKNMVRSIRHWCLATRVIAEGDVLPGTRTRRLTVTPFGGHLLRDGGWDPFLEADGSLWLLHWRLATNSVRATTWYWAFNLMKEQEFTRESLLDGLTRLATAHGWGRVSQASLKADVSCFLRTYSPGKRGPASTAEETLDCPLTSLGLIGVIGEGQTQRYRFHNGPKTGLPPAVFCYALLESWDRHHPGQETLSLREIVHGEGGPGRVFRLDDDAVLSYLDTLEALTGGKITFSDTVLTRQVRRHRPITGTEVLEGYYAR